ncbi:MAG: hypothetical protein EpisKO_41770 [Epibacterium sp.]
MSAPVAPILGTIFAPAAAGAATAGIGSTIIGGVIAGLGQGLMERQRDKAEKQEDIEREERRAARYEGAGEAMRFWNQQQGEQDGDKASGTNQFERADPNSNENLSVGQREQRQRPGEQFRRRQQPGGQRFRYDRQSAQIVPA